ncbi:MAG TPA: formate dehydrogenase accessory sulfurtransferase FdhD [Thermomicrobiales bacterium]|nr:formate dehydrogenase accessory sulfurtransferase FdhD [Thermomicrobiales bacterium]
MRVTAVAGDRSRQRSDWLATEEPLEIRVTDATTLDPVLTHVTMRTPGADFELAAGFLLAEGIVTRFEQIRQMEFCVGPAATAIQQYNIVSVEVTDPDLTNRSEAHIRTAVSACGVCGKASLDELSLRGVEPVSSDVQISQEVIEKLPQLLRERQALFESTGGLHGAALITVSGDVLAVREDVGRHNAVDKLLGWALLNPKPAEDRAILMVSGRLSYELAQKAAVGRIPVLAGVSAPSSLAVELAREFGLTLIGFLRGDSFNIYAGQGRIRLRQPADLQATERRSGPSR